MKERASAGRLVSATSVWFATTKTADAAMRKPPMPDLGAAKKRSGGIAGSIVGSWYTRLKRDEIWMNHHRALGCCLCMIFSENRCALFRIML
jgi:hypothetical protein